MKYLYYPGCCCEAKASGKAYGESLLSVFDTLGVTYEELEDWNCCGATMYMSVDEKQAFSLASRNLALAEQQSNENGTSPDLIPPCAACYAVLNKAQHYIDEYESYNTFIHNGLDAAGLEYTGKTRVRHPLDVLVNDVGLDAVAEQVKKPLNGLRVACYYGCLLVRPYATFDDDFNPTTMDQLMRTLGAEPVDWPLKTRCCGGSLSGTIEKVGVRLGYILVAEALKRGADVIATACPFCQFNLECFQRQMMRDHQLKQHVPIAFFTQLVGQAFGLGRKQIGLHRLSIPLPILDKHGEQEHVKA